MRTTILSTLAFGLSAVNAALKEISFASFGQRHSLELGHIPGWNLGGTHKPNVLSDKVVFTPPYPGEVSASAWTTQRLNSKDFTIDARIVANGADRAGGNLQIWYTKEGESSIHSDTLYTVDKFTGLVLVIDQHGGPGGGIRGFLNDGTVSFKNHPHLDTVAFGHCDHVYRNKGLPSKLQIKYDDSGLEVSVNGKLCFRSDKITLPSDYFLGITASSTATPDSFEVSKFITTTSGSKPSLNQNQNQNQQPIPSNNNNNNNQPRNPAPNAPFSTSQDKIAIEHVQDILASSLTTSAGQFADVHDRLQALGHNTERLFAEYMRSSGSLSGRIEELHSRLARFDQLAAVESKLSTLDSAVRDLKTQVENSRSDVRALINELHASVNAHHDDASQRHERLEAGLPGRIGDVVASKGPRLGVMFVALVLLQLLVLAGYWFYRRGRANSLKAGKYL